MSQAASAREIAITRVFDAPRELVWKAWTEPDRLARWWGKRGWTAREETIALDVRIGGAFRVTTVSDEDGSEMATDGVFREIVEPERLVFGNGDAISVVTFSALADGRTEMTFHSALHASEALYERAGAGLGSAFDRLAGELAARLQADQFPNP
jgi:uncharacterized protein YndB with AHSA1/START domain